MKFTTHFTFFSFILLSYIVQNLFLYPIESSLRSDEHTAIVSLLYLPHGMKVLYGIMLGPMSAGYIFLAQYISFGWFFGFSTENLIGSILGCVSIIIPIILLNASAKKDVFSAPFNYQMIKINVVWTLITLSLFTALLDSFLHMKLYFDVVDIDVFTYFIIGDFCGAIAIFMFFFYIYRPIMNKILLRK